MADEGSLSHQPLRGITWGHRRAIDPLVEASRVFAARHGGRGVEWAVRDLRAFEHQPLAEAIRDCDLLVFDHPFTGEIAGSGLFLPLDDVLARVPGGTAEATYAGPSLRSYRWQGKVWGAPVDAATMNAIYRPDLLRSLDCPVPQRWEEVIALGRAARRQGLWLGLANGDHHGFLAAGTLMHNRGAPWTATPEGGLVFDLDAFARALDALDEVLGYAHPESGHFNSIALHDAMTTRDDLAYCPLTYGYATYGEADFGQRRLAFGPFPGLDAPLCAGTLVGGAAVGITAHCADPEAARAYVAFLLQSETQDGIFASHHGQPATMSAWSDGAIDQAFNGYFSAVGETLQHAAIRPRFRGFGRFEKQAGHHVGSYLRKETTRSALLAAMRDLVGATQAQAVA
ncbi:MAG: extracellular solute-binding protein [Chelatococcus sp.]|uniref:ABC transporter substrate-binding protein n=1 Tax=Chelatococcus sp. TaxID=1953771 RepID=UPI0025BF7985|nr:extracellular solute-binding protein [Chelatococcus sp.]MBX3540303.1 extracellular solute-binding protein [Chelatococcus sp.]